MILAGDIGGTKTNLAAFTIQDGRLVCRGVRTFRNAEYDSLRSILREYRGENAGAVEAIACGIAGPVANGRSEATNIPWIVDVRELAAEAGTTAAFLINDLEATAYGVLQLPADARLPLNIGDPRPHGAIAVIAAGTGLGEGGLVWTGERYLAVASEGGHTDFAPRNELEIELLRFLLRLYKRVSYERVVSGMGIVNLYRFLRARSGTPEPKWLAEELAANDPAAAISSAALAGRDSVCAQTMELFVSLYGAEAGNLALKFLATGGVYIAGGIAPKILPLLQQATFMDAFTTKGRLSDLMRAIPVYVVLDDRAALYGAAYVALRGLKGQR